MDNNKKITLSELEEDLTLTVKEETTVPTGAIVTPENLPTTTTGTSGRKVVNPGDILPYEEKKESTYMNKQFENLNHAMLNYKDQIDEAKEVLREEDEIKQNDIEDEELDALAEEFNLHVNKGPRVAAPINKTQNNVHKVSFNTNNAAVNNTDDDEEIIDLSNVENLDLDDNDDFLADLDEFHAEESSEELEKRTEIALNKVKKVMVDGLSAYDNKLDLSSFTISKKSVKLSKVLDKKVTEEIIADWVLYSCKKKISVKALSGNDISKLDTTGKGRIPLSAFREIYHMLYSNIISDKPEFEEWLRSTPHSDENDLIFAYYMATFYKNHSILRTCSCGEIFLQKITPDKLVKFKDEAMAKSVEYLRISGDAQDGIYNTKLVQVSDDYAVSITSPTIYSIIFEPRVLGDRLIDKYNDILAFMAFIDCIYYINKDTKELEAIETNPVPNNIAKTTINKYKIYYKILNKLSSDQQGILDSAISTLESNDSKDKIEYIIPECSCPKCNKVLPEEGNKRPIEMLFTRHRAAKVVEV